MDLPHFSSVEPPDVDCIREAGRIAARTHEHLEPMIEAGQSTLDLDHEAEQYIRSMDAEPAFLDYQNTSDTITVSINDDVIHASPRPDRTLENGDVVSIDLGARYEQHYSDTAVTYLVGQPSSNQHRELVEQTKSALYAGILQATAGNTLEDIGRAIEEKSGRFGNVSDWAGHFIGRELHLAPQVFNTADQNRAFQLETGMVLAIEPVLTLSGDARTLERSAGGAVRTKSGEPGAHYEHTIRVGKNRAEILTSRSEEPQRL